MELHSENVAPVRRRRKTAFRIRSPPWWRQPPALEKNGCSRQKIRARRCAASANLPAPPASSIRRAAISPTTGNCRHRPAKIPAPANSGASSLPSNSHCIPRQIPRNGLPALAPCSTASRKPVLSSAPNAREVPDPGQHDLVRRRDGFRLRGYDDVRRRDSQTPSSPNSSCRRRNPRWRSSAAVVGANHRSPLVLGSMRPQAAVARAGHTKRARKSLEERFDLVMAGAPVKHAHMNIGARAAGEALEEVAHQFRLQIADPRRSNLSLEPRRRRGRQSPLPPVREFRPWSSENSRLADAAPVAQSAVERLTQTRSPHLPRCGADPHPDRPRRRVSSRTRRDA